MSNQTQIACVIRQAREQKKWKSAYVAYRCNISASYYSQIERGNKLPSQEILDAIFSVLEIESFSEEYTLQCQILIKELVNSIYYTDLDRCQKYYERLQNLSPISSIRYHLTVLAYSVVFKITTLAADKLTYLRPFACHMDFEEKNFYNLYHAIYLKNQSVLSESISILCKIESTNEQITALKNYHLAILYSRLNQPLLAHDANARARELFIKHNNITRLIYTLSHDAALYTQEHLYETANEKYMQLLQYQKNLSKTDQRIILLNAASNALDARDHQSAGNFLNKIRCGPDELYYDLYACLRCRFYYESNQSAQLKRYAGELNTNSFDAHYKCLISLWLLLSEDIPQDLDKEIRRAEKILQNADYDILEYFYQLIIHYYSKYPRKKLKYYEKLNTLNKRQSQ